MNKIAFILNGYPQSGKDTFADFIAKYKKTVKYSSIDKVKELALQFGWDGQKDEAGRRLLADLKHALKVYNNLPAQYVIEEYNKFLEGDAEVFVTFSRETDEIEILKQALNAKTVFISNPRVKNITSNISDAGIDNDYIYDMYICNDGTLDDLETKVRQVIGGIK